jgi:hypothetical protein
VAIPFCEPPPLTARVDLDRELSQLMDWKATAGRIPMIREEKAQFVIYTPFPEPPFLNEFLSVEQKTEGGKRLLNQRLQFLRMEIVDMAEDGNCQFRAFSMEFCGTQDYHPSGITVALRLDTSTNEIYFFSSSDCSGEMDDRQRR